MTEEDDLNERDADSEGKNIEQKITHFTDLARWNSLLLKYHVLYIKVSFKLRNLETFFLSKRFLIYNHKPEYILKEVILDTWCVVDYSPCVSGHTGAPIRAGPKG